MRPVRLAYLVTHPIQYQAPLLRRIAAEPDIELTVLFEADFSLRNHIDKGFGRAIAWDVKLLDGYRNIFLQPLRQPADDNRSASFWWPLSANMRETLGQGNFDALWVHGYSSANHLAALMLARRLGMRTFLRDDTADTSRQRSSLRWLVKRAAFAAIDRLVSAYLAVGTANAQHWRRLGIAQRKIVMMPYAVDGNLFGNAEQTGVGAAIRTKMGIAPDRPLVLFSAKLIARKRPSDLLQAIARLQQEASLHPALVMAGDGDLMAALQEEATKLGLRDTYFPGFQNQAELAALYAAADVMVLPSEWEPWGLVVNEAMNGGCAIITSDRIGAAPDLVQDNGVIYPVGDVAALTQALQSVLATRSTLERMQQRSREIIAGWSFEQDVQALRMALDLPAR